MEIYLKVQNFNDLLITNIMFFEGNLLKTYYYSESWGKGKDQNNHAILSTNNLIKLTKHRLFTINGQSSYTNFNELNIIKINNKIKYFSKYCFCNLYIKKLYKDLKKEEKKITIQRSYLFFYIEKETYEFLFKKLKKDKRIWYYIIAPNMVSIHNIPYSKIYFTDEHTAFTIDNNWRKYEKSQYKNINEILDKLYLCMVCCKKYSTPYTIEDILIEHFTTF